MPITTIREKHGIRWIATGVITDRDLHRSVRELHEDVNYRYLEYSIADLSGIDRIDITDSAAEVAAITHLGAYLTNDRIVKAYVTTNERAIELIRNYSGLMKWQARIFTNAEDADAWVQEMRSPSL